jgi:hypothetical protein
MSTESDKHLGCSSAITKELSKLTQVVTIVTCIQKVPGLNLRWYTDYHDGNFVMALLSPEVGIATGYGLDGRGVGFRVPVRTRFFFFHVVQTGSGAHPASYPIGTGGSFHGGEAAGA